MKLTPLAWMGTGLLALAGLYLMLSTWGGTVAGHPMSVPAGSLAKQPDPPAGWVSIAGAAPAPAFQPRPPIVIRPEKSLPPVPGKPGDFAEGTRFSALYRHTVRNLINPPETPKVQAIAGEPKEAGSLRKWLADPALDNIVREAIAITERPDHYLALSLWSAHSLHSARQKLILAGRPITAAELIRPRLAETENAAPIYLVAYAQLIERKKAHSGRSRSSTLDEMVCEALQDPVMANAIRNIEAATLKPCQFDLNYVKMGGAAVTEKLLPHLPPMMALSTILKIKAKLQATAGDTAGAWDSAISGLRLADALKTEPILFSQMVRIMMARTAMETVQNLARTSSPTLAQSLALDKALKSFDSIEPMVSGLDGERLWFAEPMFDFSTIASPQSKIGPSWPAAVFLCGNPLLERDHAAYLEFMHHYSALAERPYSQEALTRLERAADEEIPAYCGLTKMIVATRFLGLIRFVRFRTQSSITRTGLAILRHRQVAGVYPQSLAEAGLKEAIDPFTQKPLFYKPTDKGFLLYSAGENQNDDGGNAGPENGQGPSDIAWNYKTP
jgi:hypothetical protein